MPKKKKLPMEEGDTKAEELKPIELPEEEDKDLPMPVEDDLGLGDDDADDEDEEEAVDEF